MSSPYEQLIADYLAGQDVDNQLIDACNADPELLKMLSKDVAFSRIIAFSLQAKNDDVFNDEVAQQLSKLDRLTTQSNSANHTTEISFNRQLKSKAWQPIFSLCASLIIAIIIGINYYPRVPLAVVNKVVAAKNQLTIINEGFTLNAGDFNLTQGYAEITLNNGVILLLEAPIDLTINTVDRIMLRKGNLVARVPKQAIGFTIDTPSSEIVDLGTEFGVSVDQKGGSEVHVLTGEVKVRPSNNANFEHLIENQARAFNLEEQVAIIESKPNIFMRTLPGKSVNKPGYLHWSFDKQTGTELSCQGPGINNRCYPAVKKSIDSQKSGPSFSEGVFKQGLYFNGENTWLETEFAGIGGNKPRTVAFWLKIPSNFDVKNAFGILSWGLSDKLSAWQISPNPQPNLAPIGRIRIGTNHGQVIGTTALADNTWHHIAIVLFGGEQANLATHILIYVDGKIEKTSSKSIAKVFTELNHPKSKPLMMGRNIAFNNLNNNHQQYRFFRGWLDEVYLFDSALAEEQINNLRLNNKLN